MKINNLVIQNNANTYTNELNWLTQLIQKRLESHFSNQPIELAQLNPPEISASESNYGRWLSHHPFNPFHRLIIISALASIYSPHVYDSFLIKNKGIDKRFTEFGGRVDSSNSRFIPTLETLIFLYYGDENWAKFQAQAIFDKKNVLQQKNIIQFKTSNDNASALSTQILLTEDTLHFLTLGTKFKPDYRIDFPAKLIETDLEWEDLVLSQIIMDEVKNIEAWLKYKSEIDRNPTLQKKLNKGYKCLFYGPPGTGKTLTSSLLGKKSKQDVYRIDLSQMVSKYVGETEKNLAHIFDAAENKDWILFFDEAESLFSKRTSVTDSKDKFANQQTAYLLQRIEEYQGLVVLATNLRPNIDTAFSRRIQSVIHFPLPEFNERKILWKNALEEISDINSTVVEKLARDYKISGGSIKNVVHFSWLLSKRNETSITESEIIQGIRRELSKDGKPLDSI